MVAVSRPLPSSTTATGLPRYGVDVNTSTCWKGRCCMRAPSGEGLVEDALRRRQGFHAGVPAFEHGPGLPCERQAAPAMHFARDRDVGHGDGVATQELAALHPVLEDVPQRLDGI